MPDTSFTFRNDAHDTVSWLDYDVSSFPMDEIISEMDVLHNYLTSDHFPLSVCMQIGARKNGHMVKVMIKSSSLSSIE